MSDSVWPHRWQPTRLPRPWDSPGKSTGVGCHCLLRQVYLHMHNFPLVNIIVLQGRWLFESNDGGRNHWYSRPMLSYTQINTYICGLWVVQGQLFISKLFCPLISTWATSLQNSSMESNQNFYHGTLILYPCLAYFLTRGHFPFDPIAILGEKKS